MTRQPLVINRDNIREVAREVLRIFSPYSDKITISANEYMLQIHIHPDIHDFILPDGPISLRIWEEKQQLTLEARR